MIIRMRAPTLSHHVLGDLMMSRRSQGHITSALDPSLGSSYPKHSLFPCYPSNPSCCLQFNISCQFYPTVTYSKRLTFKQNQTLSFWTNIKVSPYNATYSQFCLTLDSLLWDMASRKMMIHPWASEPSGFHDNAI